ncbi:TPA: hypothetical protein N0F65_002304, partial [Lagenidium giganteum]
VPARPDLAITKSQGQTLAPVFAHGQLNVAVSRVSVASGLKILSIDRVGNKKTSKDESEGVGRRPWLLSMTGEHPVIVLSTPEAFDDVLQKQSDIFEKGPLKTELMRDFFGDGIVSVDGELWRLQRKRTTHSLSVFPFMAEVVEG